MTGVRAENPRESWHITQTMCTHFTATHNDAWVKKSLGVGLPPAGSYDQEVFPTYRGPLARLGEDGRVRVEAARFGLIPHWAKDATIGRRTYNARTETVADKPSYRTPWRQQQLGVCLLDTFYEPNWESGRAEKWGLRLATQDPMGVACLWDKWVDPATGEVVLSFSMLTVNADGHPVMGRFHRPADEKRSVVLLHPDTFMRWLTPEGDKSGFLACPNHTLLLGEPLTQTEQPPDPGPVTTQHELF